MTTQTWVGAYPECPVTRLILVRHGESNTTVARRIGGFRTCSGLSPLGQQQAERLGDRWLANPEFAADVLISSQFLRARQTAEILKPALGLSDIQIVDGYGEHDPGVECDGITFDEFITKYGERDWEGDPFAVGFPGGESLAAFHHRVGEAISQTVTVYKDKTIVISCHGGVIDAVLRIAVRAPSSGGFDIWTLNTSITEFELVRPGRWRLLRYNDAAHLAGLPRESPKVPMTDEHEATSPT